MLDRPHPFTHILLALLALSVFIHVCASMHVDIPFICIINAQWASTGKERSPICRLLCVATVYSTRCTVVVVVVVVVEGGQQRLILFIIGANLL